MKQFLLIFWVVVSMTSNAQTMASIGYFEPSEKTYSTDRELVLKEATMAVKQILCSNVWFPEGFSSKLIFSADNVYSLCIGTNHPINNTIYGTWLVSPTVLTIVMSERYIQHFKIISITPKAIKLADSEGCEFYLKPKQ